MADAYIKTYEIDETFILEDTNDGPDIAAFQLDANAPTDMYLWSSSFVPAVGFTNGLYAWVAPACLDAEGDPIENFYNNVGALFAFTAFSTYNDPTEVRLVGTVRVMYLPIVEDTP